MDKYGPERVVDTPITEVRKFFLSYLLDILTFRELSDLMILSHFFRLGLPVLELVLHITV